MVHVIGPGGHSNLAVEEILWRAGGLAPFNAILDAGTNLIHGAKRSNIVERTPGYAIGVMDAYGVGKEQGEVIIIVNAYGINSMTIEEVDIFIDNHLPEGDSIVEVENFSQKVASTSTFCNCFVMNLIVIETVKCLLEKGVTPPVWVSANMPGGDEHNKVLEEKYFPIIKHLR